MSKNKKMKQIPAHETSREEVMMIECIDCGVTFDLSIEEQEWYKEKGFAFPKRCKNCRKEKRRKQTKE